MSEVIIHACDVCARPGRRPVLASGRCIRCLQDICDEHTTSVTVILDKTGKRLQRVGGYCILCAEQSARLKGATEL